jgi:Glycosyl hydrolase family 26
MTYLTQRARGRTPRLHTHVNCFFVLVVLVASVISFAVSAPSAAGAASAPAPATRAVALVSTPDGQGYWIATSTGGVYSFGDAHFYGSAGGNVLNAPIVGMAATPDGQGYWLVASDGGIFSYGDAQFYGSTGSIRLNKPIVGMAATPDGRGYWLVASDGGIFSYGDAQFYGSTGSVHLNQPVVGIGTTPSGHGYWLVASDGGIFSYGDAQFYGSTGSIHLNRPVVGIGTTPSGHGYWLVASDGGIFSYGDAQFYGSTGSIHLNQPVVGLSPASGGGGYWLVAADGGVFTFGSAVFEGSAVANITSLGQSHSFGPLTGSVLGVYAGGDNPPAVSDFATSLGSRPHFAMDFLNGSSWSTIEDPSQVVASWAGSGYSMIWGVPMLPNSGASLATGATGAYNGYFSTLASRLVSDGQGDSIIRIGWEFNGGWFPWAANGQASAFVQYWQQIVTTMRSVPGENFTFEWNPTRGDLGVGDLANYYPGDAYVDYVGLDVYDEEWASYPGMPTEFENMETQPYGLNWLASFSAEHNKPMVFPEWGLGWGTCSSDGQPVSGSSGVCGGDDATFVNEMSQWIAAHNVFEATFWDYGTSSIDGGSNPNTAAALQADF